MRIAVVCAGAWGTCFARHLSERGHDTTLLTQEAGLAVEIERARENRRHLPGVLLPPALRVTASPGAVAGAELLVLATPAPVLRSTLRDLQPHLSPRARVLSATKGLDCLTGALPLDLVRELWPDLRDRLAVLAGPSFPHEVARGQPTAAVLASADDAALALELRELLSSPAFRFSVTSDVIGVQLGAALSGVAAIAAGVSEGLGFGENVRAALVSRALPEMVQLGAALGAARETFDGLAGLGNLVLGCAGPRSRNWQLGYLVGRGQALADVLAAHQDPPAAGVDTTRAARLLAHQHRVPMPLVEEVHAILFQNGAPRDGILRLLEDPAQSPLASPLPTGRAPPATRLRA
jgi:glycerol-3-phosphate dehydrogenase (NAD(P)+)